MTHEMEMVMAQAEIEDALWWEEYAAIEESWETELLLHVGLEGVENDLAG